MIVKDILQDWLKSPRLRRVDNASQGRGGGDEMSKTWQFVDGGWNYEWTEVTGMIYIETWQIHKDRPANNPMKYRFPLPPSVRLVEEEAERSPNSKIRVELDSILLGVWSWDNNNNRWLFDSSDEYRTWTIEELQSVCQALIMSGES